MKVKKRDIGAFFLAIVFYELSIFPHELFLAIKYTVVTIVFVLCIRQIKKIKAVSIFLVLYLGILVFSSYYNHMSINSCVASIIFGIFITDMFLLCTLYSQENELDRFVKIIVAVFVTEVLVNDILLLFITYDYNNPAEEYLIGNKFVVSYLHAFVFILLSFLLRKKEEKRQRIKLIPNIALCFLGIGVMVSFCVKCSTGLVAIISMALLHFVPKKILRKFCNPLWLFTLWAIMNVLIFGNSALFETSTVQRIIVDVFHKNSNMTGRLRIYAGLFSIIGDSPIIGYGYYSPVVNRLFYGNAQNGIMKIIIDSGVVGLISYLGIVFISLKNSETEYEIVRPFIIFILGMSLCSTVEICLTEHIVFLTYAILFSIACSNGVHSVGKASNPTKRTI